MDTFELLSSTYFPHQWLGSLNFLMEEGHVVAPRGKATREMPQYTIQVAMNKPVLTVPSRKLNYAFMAAEAYWILTGDNRVSSIAPYNQRIAQFSDDGETFFGAYGPKIRSQLEYVVRKLTEDRDTRQAGLTLWRENPPPTKDVPCTVAMWFQIRGSELNCHVFMRSSDMWLGIPYDVFNFSMVAYYVCSLLNSAQPWLSPGTLFLTAASSHLYMENVDAAIECVNRQDILPQPYAPAILYRNTSALVNWLKDLRETKKGRDLRWWEVLHGQTEQG